MMRPRHQSLAVSVAVSLMFMSQAGQAAGIHVANLSLTNATATDTFSQTYAVNADGWIPFNAGVSRVASGFQGVTSYSGTHHGYTAGYSGSGGVSTSGSFTRFGAVASSDRKNWDGGWTASQFVYLDTTWAAGSGFDYSVAMNNTSGNHLRDFTFHIGINNEGQLRITADNNTYNSGDATLPANSYILTEGAGGASAKTISTSGWYEMRHTFTNVGDVLSCNMQLLTSGGTEVYSSVRSDPTDLIAGVGGVRYGWFIFGNVVNTAAIPGSGVAAIGTLGLAGMARRRRR